MFKYYHLILQTHHTHTCSNHYTLQTHVRRNNAKANFPSRECINSRCRRFDLLLFRRFGSIRRHYTAVIVVQVVAVRRVADDQPWRSYRPFSAGRWRSSGTGRWFIKMNTRAGESICWCFSYMKKLLCRTKMRTREKKDLRADTNSLRHIPRRPSKNCDLQFANNDRLGCAVAEWVRALAWRGDGTVLAVSESRCGKFASELLQFRLPRFTSVFRRRY